MPGTDSSFAFPPVSAGPTPGQMATRNATEDFFNATPFAHVYRTVSAGVGDIVWGLDLGHGLWTSGTDLVIPDNAEGGYVVSLGLSSAAGWILHNGLYVGRVPYKTGVTLHSGKVAAAAYIDCKRGDTIRAQIEAGTSGGGEWVTYMLARRVV